VQRLTGVPIPDRYVVRYLPLGVLLILGGFFGPTGYWAPWRILWRLIPKLNDWFPDLNGVWVGSTSSNWPTIKRLVEAAQSNDRTTEQELHDLPEQQDAMAVRFTNSLFKLQVRAGLSSTNGESFSITAKPWRNQHTERIHLSYVYRQQTPNHAITDEEAHLGAADLAPDGMRGATRARPGAMATRSLDTLPQTENWQACCSRGQGASGPDQSGCGE